MSETPSRAALTNWLLTLVTGQLTVPQKCGDGRAQITTDAAGKPIYPYWVLYSIPGGYMGGPPLGQAQGDARYVYQIDSVGRTRAQSEMAADRVRNWLVGRTSAGVFVVQAANPDGLTIHDRIVDGTPGAPLQEGQSPNEVFTVSDTIAVDVSVR
jgi:hypothetical protein